MKFQRFNEIAELVGIVAIVASLVFVGMQMRQAQQIALSDNYLQMVANVVAINEAIAANPEIFIRGNAAEELSPEEMVIFEGQVGSLASSAWHVTEWDRTMGREVWAETDVVEFALYLHRNPGAYEVWFRREEDLDRYRALVNPDNTDAQAWIDLVHAAMARIENDQEK